MFLLYRHSIFIHQEVQELEPGLRNTEQGLCAKRPTVKLGEMSLMPCLHSTIMSLYNFSETIK